MMEKKSSSYWKRYELKSSCGNGKCGWNEKMICLKWIMIWSNEKIVKMTKRHERYEKNRWNKERRKVLENGCREMWF